MASDLGFANIATEWGSEGFPAGVYRQIWYTRYIDWVITTPALLLTLVLASGLPLSDIITLIFFDLVMIITGLVGALVESTYKWGFFAFGCAALFYIWWVLIGPARTSAAALGPGYKRAFTSSAIFLSVVWLVYPVIWGVADGGNVISPDSEMIAYGILDLIAKPVFTLYHLYSLSKLDLTVLQLSSGKFSTGAVCATAYDAEKTSRFGPNSTSDAPKKNFFGKKGKYDAPVTAVDNHPHTAGSHIRPGPQTPNQITNDQPRLSEATAVSS